MVKFWGNVVAYCSWQDPGVGLQLHLLFFVNELLLNDIKKLNIRAI